MLQFKKSVLEFQFENSIVKLRFPTMKELNSFRKSQKEKSKDEEEDIAPLMEFLVSLGMQEEIANQLEPWMFKQIIDELMKDRGDLTKKN